jgi:iron only hydrogenase large subunit-like protein
MACPGGCIAGGGQLYNVEPEKVQARARSLYELDRSSKFRVAHRNEEVRRLYDAFLQSPLSEHSIRYLHTSHGAPEV